MPKLPPRQALDELVSLIATSPHGIGLEALREAQGGKIARRTLQRRLALLVRDGRIAREGVGRAIKYRLAPITGKFNAILEDVTLAATGEVYVPTSPEGEAIKSYVRQPSKRDAVGYRNEFLEAYAPVGKEQVTFKEGEHVQFLESRRFLESEVECHLKKYSLGVVASQHFTWGVPLLQSIALL